MDKNLQLKLLNLRNNLIKINEQALKNSKVCSDEQINEIVEKLPSELNDFVSIPGLGEVFANTYGQIFLDEINKHLQINFVKTTKELKDVLLKLENRLVNISQKNRLLFSRKIIKKATFDLFIDNPTKNNELLTFLSSLDKKITIVDNTDGDSQQRYDELNYLIRESVLENDETGQSSLYIGYPFATGNISKDDFLIRAPLVLFPIKIKKTNKKIDLEHDQDSDIVFNTALIIAFNKLNKISSIIPEKEIESINWSNFSDFIKEFYSKSGIELKGGVEGLAKFKELGDKDKFDISKVYLETANNAVLGMFSFYSTSLQKDFKKLIDLNYLPPSIANLLQDYQELDNYVPVENKTENSSIKLDEDSIIYINDLNYYQEQALVKNKVLDNLVIHGPPGTGKSQTITSLIANNNNQGNSVLMVSQKKAALDVIYNRLNEINEFAIVLTDVKNKESFYNQIKNYYSNLEKHINVNFNEKILAEEIDANLIKLEKIVEKLYQIGPNGVSLIEVYNSNFDNAFINGLEKEYKIVKDNFDFSILKEGFNTVKKIYNSLNNETQLSDYKEVYKLIIKYPWLARINQKLAFLDFRDSKAAIDDLRKQLIEFNKLNFLNKILKRKELDKNTKLFVNKFFPLESAQSLSLDQLENSLNNLDKIYEKLKEFLNLESTTKKYLNVVLKVSASYSGGYTTLNKYIFDFLCLQLINDFEANNAEVIKGIKNFSTTVTSISKLIETKKSTSKKIVLNKLIKTVNENVNLGKRSKEIQKAIDSKRKMSVIRFVSKFKVELFHGIKIWLLTPEVASEILPFKNNLFELVIFDEASQMFVEKSLTSIFRSKKVIVSGDEKQLRPSNLGFGRAEALQNEDLDNEAMINDVESLLDLAKYKYDSTYLRYHYRSIYEELVAFSNHAFYDQKLIVSPNSVKPVSPPISVIKIEDGLWKNRSNLVEAKKVLQTIKAIIGDFPKESLGVITFNSNQRDLILDLIDNEINNNQEFAKRIKERKQFKNSNEDDGFFVKNIENVQGDERDIIIFSVGYAKDEKGKVSNNFGWLSQQGGENRLNVAITRARKKIIVVTSINANELKTDKLKNDGAYFFKKYLEYAFAVSENDSNQVQLVLNELSKKVTKQNQEELNPLVLDVDRVLRQFDYKTEVNIGIGGYKIDIAVLDKENNYILAIECDGKINEQNLEARDRDYHRIKYLESRGWDVYRIWSSNWWHDKQEEIEKINKIISKKMRKEE
jgi:superfamily I DNA and/or RNA helicase/very-short-patch-repair endonuclease